MAERMTIPYVRDDRWEAGTRLALRIGLASAGPAGLVAQNDRILPWGSPGSDTDVEAYGEGVYGFSGIGGGGQGLTALEYGEGLYGAGVYGIGAELLEHVTLAAFDEGDYLVELVAYDIAGNASPADTATIAHRPDPPPPRNFTLSSIDTDFLVWDWP